MSIVNRWMVFVDGENITARAEDILSERDPDHPTNYAWKNDSFFWGHRNGYNHRSFRTGPHYTVNRQGGTTLHGVPTRLRLNADRARYYTSTTGNEEDEKEVQSLAKEIGFQPIVFRVAKAERDRFDRIDVRLATDLVGDAHRDNFDVAVLAGGDGDYVPAVKEVQRQGKIVILAGFEHDKGGVSGELRLVCDYFVDLHRTLLEQPDE